MESCTALFLHNSPCQDYIDIDIYLILKGVWVSMVSVHMPAKEYGTMSMYLKTLCTRSYETYIFLSIVNHY